MRTVLPKLFVQMQFAPGTVPRPQFDDDALNVVLPNGTNLIIDQEAAYYYAQGKWYRAPIEQAVRRPS